MSKKSTTLSRSLKNKVKKSPKRKDIDGEELTEKSKFAVWFYIHDKDCFGNYTKAYQKAYGVKYDVAKSAGPRLFAKVCIVEYKNKVLDELITNAEIDRELMYVIKQNKDQRAKVSAVSEMNKLKGRILEKAEVKHILPKPILASAGLK